MATVQDDLDTDINLEEIDVYSSRVPLTQAEAPRLVTVMTAEEIKVAPVQSVNDLLEYAAGVDVRQRGENGVQTDISLRGGTFDQITVLLNGVNISSPHTGHLSADFPVSISDIERVEVVEGPAARVFGTSAFTGVINIVTKSSGDEPEVEANLSMGQYDLGVIEIAERFTHDVGKNRMGHHFSLGTSSSDGATGNSDFSSFRAFYRNDFKLDNATVHSQLGYSYKDYGANTFYGAASKDQWESNERIMAAVNADVDAGILHFSPTFSWNRWFDHYQWHRNTDVGENFHQVDTWAVGLNTWFESIIGKTSIGFEMRSEGIYSTKLGEPLETTEYFHVRGHDRTDSIEYRYGADRTNVAAFVEHNVILDNWTIQGGILANMNTALDCRWRLYPGIDISYRPAKTVKISLSYNEALRMPTFTDLYYSGVNIAGTSDLKPERTKDLALGARFRQSGIQAQTQLFYSKKNDMIDWVIYASEPDGSTFRTGNFYLDSYGVEVQASFLPAEIFNGSHLRRLSVQYAYIDQDIEYYQPVIRSKYAMEYLRNKLVLQADANIFAKLDLSLSWRWQDRTGEGNSSYNLLDGRLSWNERYWSIYADCSNILDRRYFDYSYIEQPGRWLRFGVKVTDPRGLFGRARKG